MLQRLENYEGLTIRARDGDVGAVIDFLVDDQHWAIRYLVVKTGTWLGRHVLVSPMSIGQPDWNDLSLEVDLTRNQIRQSPDAELESVSPELELAYLRWLRYRPYWLGERPWGTADSPSELRRAGWTPAAPDPQQLRRAGLHSVRHLRGSHLHARDEVIGHIDDMIIDDDTWRIRDLLIDTSDWVGGRWVFVPVSLIVATDWSARKITVSATGEQITTAPQYQPHRAIDGTMADDVDRHYRVAPVPPYDHVASRGAAR